VVRLLLGAEGIIADPKDDRCQTPLSYAAEAGHGEIVKLLLTQTRAEAAHRHAVRQRALSYATRGDLDSLVRLLFAAVGVDPYSHDSPAWMRLPPNTTYRDSNTALEFLYLIGSTQTEEWARYSAAAMVFTVGAGRNIVARMLRVIDEEYFKNGHRFLDQAVEAGVWAVRDWGEVGSDGFTAVVMLLGSVGKEGRYRVMSRWCVDDGGLEAAVRRLFPIRNVDPDWKDDKGLTPLDYATAGGHEMVVELLLESERPFGVK
jgi:hypothetical protein